MEWGWVDTVADMRRRIDELEFVVKQNSTNSVPEVHEIETIPCLSQDRSGTDMVGTHSTANAGKVFVIPFKFSGQIFLRRMSLVCAATAGNSAKVGLCLYSLDSPSRVDQLNPRSNALPALRKLKKGSWTEPDGTGHVRLSVEYSKGIYLNTSRALYFAAWTIDDQEGRVFCPNSGAGALDATKSFLAAFTTNGTASTSDGFPDTLSITGDTDARAAPCVVGRSLTGIRIYGSFTDD